jgi:hypothetical protein
VAQVAFPEACDQSERIQALRMAVPPARAGAQLAQEQPFGARGVHRALHNFQQKRRRNLHAGIMAHLRAVRNPLYWREKQGGAMATAKAQSKKAPPKKPADFDAVFARLCSILAPHARTLAARNDQPGYYYLETKAPLYKGRPVFFGAVRKGKSYVSFHLMPVYAYPEMRKSLSPALRQRMQGKSCFNFTAVDEELFEELRQLTAKGAEGFPEKMLRGLSGAKCA